MNAVKTFFSAGLLFLLCLQTVHATNKQEQINKILEQTGFDKLLEHIPSFAQGTLKQSSGALEPEMSSALSAAFNQAFTTAAVQRDVINVINAHYDESQATAYLKQLQSPLAVKMAELERNTNTPTGQQEIKALAAKLQENPAPKSRSNLIQQLDKANRTTDFSVDMQTAFFKAIFVAIDPVMDADMRLGDGELDNMVTEVRESLEENLRPNTRLSYMYAFRDISDDELKSYIDLCESTEYRWAIQLLGNAMISALNKAADRAAMAMIKASRELR